ncbi:hypothetical protein ABIE41_003786 [Bosea sp. OAE506]|uniref:hypothetical protein n=1 Tax=Bosea sp. OAE506 TaxID=2663870 RepID=UPI00178B7A0D
MTKVNNSGETARDEARPSEADLSKYERNYRLTTDRVERFYVLWRQAMAHALLLEQQGDRTYPEHGGLTALQLAEGARAHARFFAFLLAEAPAQTKVHLEAKVSIYADMASDPDEIRRSRTARMVGAAMQQDAGDLGITLPGVPLAPGSESWH